jgi:hypothetical protein
MDKRSLMSLVKNAADIQSKLDAVHQLREHPRDAEVLAVLCNLAIETDTHRLREAAIRALENNAGLHDDEDVLNTLEIFFARNRSLFVLDGVCQAAKHFRPLMQRLLKTYSIYFHQDSKKAKEKNRLYVKFQTEKMSGP